MAGEQETLKKLIEVYSGRLKFLKEFRNLTGKISDEIESKGEEAIDIIAELTENRESILDKIKEADASARRCESALGGNYKKMMEEIKSAAKNKAQPAFKQDWAVYLFKNFTEYDSLVKIITEADKRNAEAIKAVMENLKIKMNAVKENKKMMDKFSDGFDKPSVGTLMNEKK